jgi:hypothetical protein
MSKSKPKVKRAISKTKSKAVSKPKKIKAAKVKKVKPKKKITKAVPKTKKVSKKAKAPRLDTLPPPPPDLLRPKPVFKPKGLPPKPKVTYVAPNYMPSTPKFKPSGHELARLTLQLKNDVNFINNNRMYLTMPMEKAVEVSDAKLMAVHDILNDEKKYTHEVEETEQLIASYEGIHKKGWLSEKKINEARHYLEAYKLVAEHTRKDIVKRIEQIRKQKEINAKAEKEAKEAAKKSEVIKSLEEPKKVKLVVKELPPPPHEDLSHKELHKHVSQLKDSLGHVKKREGIFKKVKEQLHTLSHKELHHALGHLKTAKEHLGKIENVEEHIAAHASVTHTKKIADKIGFARMLLEKHDIDVAEKKAQINEHIKDVKKKIKEVEKVKKEAEDKESKLKEEKSSVLPKMKELKSHIRYVIGNRKLLQIPEERLRKLPSKKLYDISNKLNIIKQYIGGIEDVESHLVAESSKPHSVIAEKHLNEARNLIKSHKLDIEAEKSLIDGKVDLIKNIAKSISKPVPIPKKLPPKPSPKPEKLLKLKPLKPEPKKEEKPKKKEEAEELEVPVPVFEKPKPEIVKLIGKLRKDLNYVKKNEKSLDVSDEALGSLSTWRLKGVDKNLKALRHYMEELQDTEEHIAAESSMPQGLMAEKQLEQAKKLMSTYSEDLPAKLKELNSKIKLIEERITAPPGEKPALKPAKLPKAKEMPELPEPEMPAPELPEPEIPKGPVKKIRIEPKEHIPEAPKVGIGRGKPEVAMLIYKLKRDLGFAAKNDKFLKMSDEVLKSVAKWRLNGIVKNLELMKAKLEALEETEVEIAAQASVKQPEAVEKQLEEAKNVMDSYNINVAKKLKEVKSRLSFVREQLMPLPAPEVSVPEAKLPKMKTLEEEFKVKPEMPKPELPKAKLPAPKLEKPVEEIPPPKGMPPAPAGVPVFKPSPAELVVLISRLKRDLDFISKYERLMHVPDEHITNLSHKKIDHISGKLKSERKYLDDLEEIENRIHLYERIPNKGWLSSKKIAEARALLEAYKSQHVGMTRKMVVNRLDLLKGRKQAMESDRTKLAKLAVAEKKGHVVEEAKTLKDIEEHVAFREKSAAEERLADLRHLQTLKAAEKYKRKVAGVPKHTIVSIKPSVPVKPALEKTHIDSRKEISKAIESVKTGRPLMENSVEYIIHRIDEARTALIDLDTKTAKDIYLEVHSIYLGLRPLEQYRVYESLTSLYEERKAAEKLVS